MWLAIGLVLGAVILWFILWIHQRNIRVTWYEYLIGSLGLLLLLFTIQNFSAFLDEYEKVAAWNSLLVFGLPSILLIATAFFLFWCRHRYRKTGSK